MEIFRCNEEKPFVSSILSEEDLAIGRENLNSWRIVNHLCECVHCKSYMKDIVNIRTMIHANIEKAGG